MLELALKDSGVRWIGRIPQTWRTVLIRHLSPVRRGASPRPIDDPKYFDEDGEYSWVRISDVTSSNKYLQSAEQRLSKLGKSLSVPLEPGNLFLSIAGSVGKPIITKIKCCIHDGFVYFPYYKEDPNFLYYIFLSGAAFGGLGKLGTQLNLNTDIVGDIKIPLPSLLEQRSISFFLDFETSRIDSLISKKERQIELLQEKRQAIITRAVTKGLDPNVKMKDSGVEWIGEIPARWGVRKLKHIASLKSGVGITTEGFSDEGDYPVYGGNGLRGYTSSFTHDGHFVLIGRQGALCGNINYTQGKFWASEHAVVVSPTQKVAVLWLGEVLRTIDLNKYSVSAAQPGLSVEKIRELKFPFPSYEQQRQMGYFFENEIIQSENLIKMVRDSIQLLQEYRSSLITAAVSGQIDVSKMKSKAPE